VADIIRKLADKAGMGDMDAIKTWLAYRWGKPIETQDVKHSGEVGVKTIVMLPPKVDPG
jgi:hypothetical protein